MKPPAVITAQFEGHALTTIDWKGQPAWIAAEVGRAMGYAKRGSRLVTRITRDWAEEFIYGHDYLVVTGDELDEFKLLLGPGTESVPGRTAQLALLLEPGLHLALTKTNKPVGRKLRRFLVDEVLPRIVRGEQFEDRYEVASDFDYDEPTADLDDDEPLPPMADTPPVLVTPRPAPVLAWEHPDPRILRERRLARQVDLNDRKLRSRALRDAGLLLHTLGDINDADLARCELAAARIALGDEPPTVHEGLPPGWVLVGELSQHLGAGALAVTVAMMELNLHDVRPGLSGVVLVPSDKHEGHRARHVLSPAGVERLRQHLIQRGDLPAHAA